MYLGLIEARYDYQLSYLEQWALAWRQQASKTDTFNLVEEQDIKRLAQSYSKFDLLVVLHSVTADSNFWIEKLASLNQLSRSPMILFVGNEFSSPFLSMETRLKLISEISPELIASQIPLESARWLYEKTGSQIVSAPPGIPETSLKNIPRSRPIDLGYRGFPYPWYLLDADRNDTVESVAKLFKENSQEVDLSFTQRFDSSMWFEFLSKTRFTVSSEAGSRFVFRDDSVWIPVQEYFSEKHKYSTVRNDMLGMSFLRQLPRPIKKFVKKASSLIGIYQASLYNPDAREREKLAELVDPSRHEYRDGKAISSRHLDAIACGTWQILKPGAYNNILKVGDHFTPWDPSEISSISELILDSNLLQFKTQSAFESLKSEHSYLARIGHLLKNLR